MSTFTPSLGRKGKVDQVGSRESLESEEPLFEVGCRLIVPLK